ncbi:MAG TPA: NAD(P) transhydrogenase subunit beta [Bacteroidetes bacterium]|nr:NAD(P) transhydrogenase subunit beta [Bacteroidota bacterium]HCN36781.1 NAD(P) transhydrogenase subunit beta [Bacteroidota bacterium]
MKLNILEISYLISSVTFILGLKMLSNPESARKGNLIAAAGMTLAIFTTIFLYESPAGKPLGNYVWIFGGIAVGTLAGVVAAKKVQMTAMPQMVSLFNGLGALCVAIISFLEYLHFPDEQFSDSFNVRLLIILAGLVIGSVSFSGSIIAYGKLEGKIKDFHFPFHQFINLVFLLIILIMLIIPVAGISHDLSFLFIITFLSIVYGLFFVFPIGGADMPVVISLLNSFTGIAAALGGFLYDNQVMLTGGILVGSSGTILTILMCKAMNRSLWNVVIGTWNASAVSSGAKTTTGSIKEISIQDTAVLMSYSKSVVIVPGYGLAVAQAQHTCKELEQLLEEKGVEVKYAIHPVAGRMPGHMNVLLAEADVSYDKLLEMDEINPEFVKTDVVLILGANDVVNPAALTDPSSPIYGMPILEVINAKNIIVNKRSMSAGYAGIDNELFYNDKTKMLFGDSKKVLGQLVNEIKTL